MKNKRIIALLLALAISFSFVSCNKDCACGKDCDCKDCDGVCDGSGVDKPGDGSSAALSPASFCVRVVTTGGMPVKDVNVYVHKSDNAFDLAGSPKLTDENGVAEFDFSEEGNYSVQLVPLHDRYVSGVGDAAHGRYSVKNAELVITLDYNPDYAPSYYTKGDKLPDFTLTSVDGEEYNLYSLLEAKDMVMLNFWFINCPPCRAEFPAINAAYGAYGDSVEILAINNTDATSSILAFPDAYGIDIDFPLLSVKGGLNPGSFGSAYCPTTVIVDRYGVVCLVEIGGIPSEAVWNRVFGYFTSDDYTQRLFDSTEQIPS